MSKLDKLQAFTVKVNDGSGCLFQPQTREYTYVLTAKHVFENQPLTITRQILIDAKNLVTESLQVIGSPFLHNDLNKDAAIIKVKFIERADPLFRIDSPFEDCDEFYLSGHPFARRDDEFSFRHNKISIENSKPNGYLEASLIPPALFKEIVGQSGGGIIGLSNGNYFLAGIQKKMSTADNSEMLGRIDFMPLAFFDEIVNQFPEELKELLSSEQHNLIAINNSKKINSNIYDNNWVSLTSTFLQYLTNIINFLAHKSKDDLWKKTKIEFPYEDLPISNLYSKITSLPNSEIPYVERLPKTEYDGMVAKMNESRNLLIIGRAGLGKTREAVEFIRRLETDIGEDISVIRPNGSLEVPHSVPMNKLKRNVVLFIDDLPSHYIEPYRTTDPNDPKLLENFRQRLDQTIQVFSGIYGNRFRVITTVKGEPDLKERIKLNDQFWDNFTILELPDLSKDKVFEFLRTVEESLQIQITVPAKLFLSDHSDGTFGGLIIPIIKERMKQRIELKDVEQYRCTYPLDWEGQVYKRYFLTNIYRKNIIIALSLVQQLHMVPLEFLVIEIAAQLCSSRFLFWSKMRLRREIENIRNWVQLIDGQFHCPDAYLEGKANFTGNEQILLNSISSLINKRRYFDLLLPSLYELINSLFYSFNNAAMALEVNTQILRITPNNSRALTRIAVIYQQLKRYKEAETASLKAIELNDHPVAWATLANSYSINGLYKEASEAFSEAIKRQPKSDILLMQSGIVLSRLGNLKEAIQLGKDAVALNPFNSLNHIALAISMDRAGLFEDAIEACKAALSLDEENAIGWSTLGVTYSKAGQFSLAIEAGKKSVQLAPESDVCWSNLAQTHDRAGNLKDSIEIFEQLLKFDSQNDEIWLSLGIAFEHSGDYEKAFQALKQATELNNTNAKAWQALAFNALNNNNEIVKEALNKASILAPHDYKMWLNKGVCSAKIEEYDAAFDAFTKAIQLNPSSSRVWYAINNFVLPIEPTQSVLYQKLLTTSEKIAELIPQDVRAWMLLATTCLKAKNYDKAKFALVKAIELNPKNVLTLRLLYSVYINLGEIAAAEEIIDRLKDTSDEASLVLLNIAIAHKNAGQYETAIRIYEKIIEMDPKHIKAWKSVGILYNQIDQHEMALKISIKLTELEPHIAYNWYALATQYRKTGNPEKAVETYLQVIKNYPKSPYSSRARKKIEDLTND